MCTFDKNTIFLYVFLAFLALLGFPVGMVIGRFAIVICPSTSTPPTVAPPPTEDESIIQRLMDEISASNIKENLRYRYMFFFYKHNVYKHTEPDFW